jgi:hypothetical protein
MVKANTPAVDVPVLVTAADDPGAPVVVVPTATVTTVAPVAPCGPAALRLIVCVTGVSVTV